VCFSVVLHSLAVGVAAVGVGAAVVVVAVVQWSNLESRVRGVGGGATHTTLCISQSRIGFGPTIRTETLRVLAPVKMNGTIR
jgi:hypothetical protein